MASAGCRIGKWGLVAGNRVWQGPADKGLNRRHPGRSIGHPWDAAVVYAAVSPAGHNRVHIRGHRDEHRAFTVTGAGSACAAAYRVDIEGNLSILSCYVIVNFAISQVHSAVTFFSIECQPGTSDIAGATCSAWYSHTLSQYTF
jgi:hypothetical protein